MIDETEKERLEGKRMPDGYIVLDNDGNHVYSSEWFDFCNDHINDCALSESVSSWVIRGFVFVKKDPKNRNHKVKGLAAVDGVKHYD